MLEKLERINVLYDIYGDLLTERQREVIVLYYLNDYSLGEISEHYQVSRQAVHDMIKRSVELLEKLEEKLGIYQGYFFRKEVLNQAMELLSPGELTEKNIEKLKIILGELYRENEGE